MTDDHNSTESSPTNDESAAIPTDADELPFDLADAMQAAPEMLRQLQDDLPADGEELDDELAAFDSEFDPTALLGDDVDPSDLFAEGADPADLLDELMTGDETADDQMRIGETAAESDGGVEAESPPSEEQIDVSGDGHDDADIDLDFDPSTVEAAADAGPDATDSGTEDTGSADAASESPTDADTETDSSRFGGFEFPSTDGLLPSRDDFDVPSGDDVGPDAESWKARARSVRAKLALIGGAPGVAAATIVGFEGLTYAVGKYIPAYLISLGASPVIVGLYGSLMIAMAALGAAGSSYLPDSGLVQRFAALVASGGLAMWAMAPGIASASPIPAWFPVLAGVVLVGALGAIADSPVDLIEGPHARKPTPTRRSLRRTGGILVGLALVAVLVTTASSVLVALQVALALAAALGITVAAFPSPDESPERGVSLPGVLEDTSPNADVDSTTPANPTSTTATVEEADSGRLGTRALRSGITSLSSGARALLIGETLIEAAIALTLVFVVVVSTSVLAVSIDGFGPFAAFTALVAIERIAGLAAARLGPSLADAAGSRAPVIIGAILAAVFPLLLISAPPNALVVGFAFGLFGLRFMATDARDRLQRSATDHAGRKATRVLRTGVLIVSPLIGGVLYQLSPVLAFGVATTIGALGVRELASAAHKIDHVERANV